MALITCRFFSEALGMSTTMTVILPEQTRLQIGMEGRSSAGKHPTLYLLHGLSDDDSIWLRRTSIERYVAPLGVAVVMPNVHKSFYTDMTYGDAYWTFLSEELPAAARSFFPLSDEREDNVVAGLSMGGYGAFKWALRHPDRFRASASLSGALDIAARIEKEKGTGIGKATELVFGGRDVRGTDDDLLSLLEKRAGESGPKPELYQICGTEDFLYDDNVAFKETCQRAKYPSFVYEEGPGDHNWEFWDANIQKVLARFFPVR